MEREYLCIHYKNQVEQLLDMTCLGLFFIDEGTIGYLLKRSDEIKKISFETDLHSYIKTIIIEFFNIEDDLHSQQINLRINIKPSYYYTKIDENKNK